MAKKTWWEAACDFRPLDVIWWKHVTSSEQATWLDQVVPEDMGFEEEEAFMLLCFLALEAGEEIPELWLVKGEVYYEKEQAHCIGCAFYRGPNMKTCESLPCTPSVHHSGRTVIYVRAEEA